MTLNVDKLYADYQHYMESHPSDVPPLSRDIFEQIATDRIQPGLYESNRRQGEGSCREISYRAAARATLQQHGISFFGEDLEIQAGALEQVMMEKKKSNVIF